MDLNTYLAENGNWIRVRSGAAITSLSDTEWQATLTAAAELGGADPGIDCGLSINPLSLTEIEAVIRTWHTRGTATRCTIGDFAALRLDGCRRHRGETPRPWIVLDLGDRRLILE